MSLGLWNGVYGKYKGCAAFQFIQQYQSLRSARPHWVAFGVLARVGVF